MKSIYITLSFLILFSCQSPESKKIEQASIAKTNFYALGQEITTQAQAELMKNVKAAIDKGGPVNAIRFCNIHAMPIVDSLSSLHNCQISRVSTKNRNSNNKPSHAAENLLLNHMIENTLDGATVLDTVVADNGQLIYYRPIYIAMETCLKCHGQIGTDINAETSLVLNELYPEDKATNYRLGEFRGAWKIIFDLSENN